MKKILYKILRVSLIVFFKMVCRVEVFGAENVPKTGPVILAPSHFSNFDPPVMGAVCPRRDLCFFAKEELFKNKFFGAFLKFFGAFPVKRGRIDKNALLFFLELLKKENTVLIFPEGTRRKKGRKPVAKKGLGFIVYHSKSPVIPVKLINTDKILKFKKVEVRFGKPMFFASSLDYQEISQKVLESIEEI